MADHGEDLDKKEETLKEKIVEKIHGGDDSSSSLSDSESKKNLPRDCISSIIALTTPKDVCRASTVSSDFKSASESNIVWEGFLPADLDEIISGSVKPSLDCERNKELFFKLCDSPILIDNGKLSFWLSKSSGKKCCMLGARELSILWQGTPEYWGWTDNHKSRFSDVYEFRSDCCLDIQGKMHTQKLSLKTTYAAYLVYKIAKDSHGLEVVAKVSVTFTEATSSVSNTTDAGIGTDMSASINLLEPDSNSIYLSSSPRSRSQYPPPRPNGWMEIFLGKFYNDEGEREIEIKLLETKFLNGIGGLILEGIEFRPMECG